MNTQKKNIYYLTSIVICMVVSILYLTIQSATAGVTLSQLEKERIQLARENQMLSHNLAQKTSLSSIQIQAHDLGFFENPQTVYLGGGDYFADSSTRFTQLE